MNLLEPFSLVLKTLKLEGFLMKKDGYREDAPTKEEGQPPSPLEDLLVGEELSDQGAHEVAYYYAHSRHRLRQMEKNECIR